MGLIRGKSVQSGYTRIVGPEQPDLNYIEFGLLALGDGQRWEHTFEGVESVLVILGGRCDIEANGRGWANVGDRDDVFGGKATAAYCPPSATCRVVGRGQVTVAVCCAQADGEREPILISPDSVRVREVGQDTFQRSVHDIAAPCTVEAQRLIVGETYNRPGRWSSYPPHKHDIHNPPEESELEEVYYFRVSPAQGFGVQRVYGDGSDDTYAVCDGDVVTIAEGYHPVGAAPGYELYYLWILAGEHRIMHPCDDPQHSWVLAQR
jgi:5-deoxy-glucuronate isomerase